MWSRHGRIYFFLVSAASWSVPGWSTDQGLHEDFDAHHPTVQTGSLSKRNGHEPKKKTGRIGDRKKSLPHSKLLMMISGIFHGSVTEVVQFLRVRKVCSSVIYLGAAIEKPTAAWNPLDAGGVDHRDSYSCIITPSKGTGDWYKLSCRTATYGPVYCFNGLLLQYADHPTVLFSEMDRYDSMAKVVNRQMNRWERDCNDRYLICRNLSKNHIPPWMEPVLTFFKKWKRRTI